jgi:hypothetical protein
MAVSPIPSSSRPAKSARAQLNSIHLIDKLDSLAKFYQRQLEWVDSTRVDVNPVETESDADDELSETETRRRAAVRPLTTTALRRMHWRRQMRSLETKLSGKVHKRRKSASRRPTNSSTSSRREVEEEMGSHHILGMFGQIIGARMESCRRVQKLVAFNTFDDKRNAARYGIVGSQCSAGLIRASCRSPDQPRVDRHTPESSNEIIG